MGVYDTYGDIQIKVGNPCQRHFEIDNEVDIPDGVYVAPDGVVVIADGFFVATFDTLIDKWGRTIYPNEIISAWL